MNREQRDRALRQLSEELKDAKSDNNELSQTIIRSAIDGILDEENKDHGKADS